MAAFKPGDRVKICDRADWKSAGGYPLKDTEGIVVRADDPVGFAEIYIEKTNAEINTKTRITVTTNGIVLI